jgi:hypothetical protein
MSSGQASGKRAKSAQELVQRVSAFLARAVFFLPRKSRWLRQHAHASCLAGNTRNFSGLRRSKYWVNKASPSSSLKQAVGCHSYTELGWAAGPASQAVDSVRLLRPPNIFLPQEMHATSPCSPCVQTYLIAATTSLRPKRNSDFVQRGRYKLL